MILLNLTGIKWRWWPWFDFLGGYYLDMRWLCFQLYLYTPRAADMIVGVLSNPMNFPSKRDRP